MSFNWYYNQDSWVLDTGNFSGTYTIGLSFVFLAYFLHPAIEDAYKRVRAYRAWRAIEKKETVEVTAYGLVAEVLGGRHRWDAARIITLLLTAFSVASWGLELQLDLASIENTVADLYLRPPPVWVSYGNWHVIRVDDLDVEDGAVPNMEGDFSNGSAKARYRVDREEDPVVDGVVRVAWWSTTADEAPASLFYNVHNGTTFIDSIACAENLTTEFMELYLRHEDTAWGSVASCEQGPSLANLTKGASPPTILLNGSKGAAHMIVEETSLYPSFLYSVWEAEAEGEDFVKLRHIFHVASTARLAEAVVTEVVHAEERSDDEPASGGGSFALLREFSGEYSSYTEYYDDTGLGAGLHQRASPFGERPSDETPGELKLSDVETIEAGVLLNSTALVCALWLIALTLTGIALALTLKARIGMDVYNRDELIRAVSLQGVKMDEETPSAIRIFVRREDTGNMNVVISDTADKQSLCERLFNRESKVLHDDSPAPVAPVVPDSGGSYVGDTIPAGPRTYCLEAFRTGMGRAFPGREGNYHYPVALSASPVPSQVGSCVGTPAHALPSPVPVNATAFALGDRGPSVLFGSFRSLYDSSDGGIDADKDKCSDGDGGGCSKVRKYPSVKDPSASSRSDSHSTQVEFYRGSGRFQQGTSTSTLPEHSPLPRLLGGALSRTPPRMLASTPTPAEETKEDGLGMSITRPTEGTPVREGEAGIASGGARADSMHIVSPPNRSSTDVHATEAAEEAKPQQSESDTNDTRRGGSSSPPVQGSASDGTKEPVPLLRLISHSVLETKESHADPGGDHMV